MRCVLLSDKEISRLLKLCGNTRDLLQGREIHSFILNSVYKEDRWLTNLLIEMYGKCGSIQDAELVFNEIPSECRNLFSWNIMLQAYSHNRHLCEAKACFDSMPKRDVVSWTSIFSVYAQERHLAEARQVAEMMPYRDVVSWNAVIQADARGGRLAGAKWQFDRLPRRSTATWNSLVAAFAESGLLAGAEELYARMPCHDVAAATAMIQIHGEAGNILDCESLFAGIPKDDRDLVLWGAMLACYAQNGFHERVLECFDLMPHRDHNVFSLNALLLASTQNKNLDVTIAMFKNMLHRDLLSWATLISAYARAGHPDAARAQFVKMPLHDLVSWTAMLEALVRGQETKEAQILFERFPYRDMVAWCTLLAAYAQCGHLEDAKELFMKMPVHDVLSWTTMIQWYGWRGHVAQAQQMLEQMPERHMDADVAVLAAHAQAGHIGQARELFDAMKAPFRDLELWNAMIAGYARSGLGDGALDFFRGMELEGITPNEASLAAILFACSHGGIGIERFVAIARDHGDGSEKEEESLNHFLHGVVDALARAGRLSEAEELLHAMPHLPEAMTWKAVLSACRIQSDVDRGKRIAAGAAGANPHDPAPFSLLSSIFAV
ncbi:hypothetical protein SELMODRAFT_81078 [Selaginella moellendorffii]|uniref:Pentacotripeptide-repeat region of PRORP domain-containing protein n=1 Tax=Selaginella moellendorffii TaxID=88036 RepID=D8R0C0_SELML|nr:hypothetical protein SELMODRAFT_81078 [Selaginella moellendorffii]